MELAGGGIIGLLHLIAFVYALIKIIQSPTTVGMKVLWAAIVLIFPCIGLIVWFFIGPK